VFGAVPLPIPLSIISNDAFTFPYYIMLVGFIIAFATLLLVRPSFRKYRRKRSIILYVAAALVIILLLFQIDNAGRRAIVNIDYKGESNYYPGQIGRLTMETTNFGDRAANFFLVISNVNASFQPEQNFIYVDRSTIKVAYLLQERWSSRNGDQRNVAFTIDENVSGFSFLVSWEQQGSEELIVTTADTGMAFVWNGTQNCYVLDCVTRVCA
jgi:hypothetical protein